MVNVYARLFEMSVDIIELSLLNKGCESDDTLMKSQIMNKVHKLGTVD